MKGSHIYNRMGNQKVFNSYLKMIKDYEIDTVKDLISNVTMEASDHPKYAQLMLAYNERLLKEV